MLYVDGVRLCDVTYTLRRVPGARGAAVAGVVRPVTGDSWASGTEGGAAIVGADAAVELCRDGWWWDCVISGDDGRARSRGANLHRRA